MRKVSMVLVAFVATNATLASAKPLNISAQTTPAIEALLRCRSLTDTTRRLACFDDSSAELNSSIARKDVVIVDRAQVQETKRSLFGFAIPDLGIFRSSDKAKDVEDKQIVAQVRSAHTDAEGNWVVALDNGAVWHQTDGQSVAQMPHAGDTVTIVRGTLGSYFMRLGKQSGVKAKRDS